MNNKIILWWSLAVGLAIFQPILFWNKIEWLRFSLIYFEVMILLLGIGASVSLTKYKFVRIAKQRGKQDA